jgi:putative glutamine amidotransferase
MGWQISTYKWRVKVKDLSMSKTLPVVGIACDVMTSGMHPMHGVGEKYINAAANGAQALPMLLPTFGDGKDINDLGALYQVEDIVSRIDGLFLPGSPSNIQPRHYAGPAHADGTLEDPQRDSLSLQLIRCCIDHGVPIFAVCRGFQELNVALGGSLHAKVHEVSPYHEHREDKSKDRDGQYGPSHSVNFVSGGWLHSASGDTSCQVNSLHSQGINRLADGLEALAHAEDGLIEAVMLKPESGCWAVGVQWHPEWQYENNQISKLLFSEFGQQMRKKSLKRAGEIV